MTERTTTSLRTTCSRCGTYSSGSAWCPTCGLNLRVSTAAAVDDESRPAPEALYSRPGPAAPPPERRRPGSLVVLVAVAVSVLVAGVLLTVLLTRGGGSTPARGSTPPRASTVAAAPSATTTVPPTPSTPTQSVAPVSADRAPAISTSRIADVLRSYEAAYTNESLDGLRALFADDFERQNGHDAPEGVEAALETYQRQFDDLSDPTYKLRDLTLTPGEGEGDASAIYEISSDTGTVTGGIAFHLVERDGDLLIDYIAVRPS